MPAFGHKLSKAVLAFGVYGTILTRVLHYGTILFDDRSSEFFMYFVA